jgi:small redox-active disulfide protein 2
MKIQILGTGCQNCVRLAKNAEEAAKAQGSEYVVEKITDIKEIMSYGVMQTPALAIDGKVKSVGRTLSVEEIKKLLQ